MSADPLRDFRLEAAELIERLDEKLLALERGEPGGSAVDALLRAAHTLKGAALTVGAHDVGELTHRLEDVLQSGRRTGKLVLDAVRRALDLVDDIAEAVQALAPTPPRPTAPGEELERPGAEPAPASAAGAVGGTVRVELGELDAVLEDVAEAGVLAVDLRRMAAEIDEASVSMVRQVEGAGRRRELAGAAIALVELAEQHRARLARIQRRLQSGIDRIEREIDGARRRIGRVRLTPARSIFGGLGRAVRDAAHARGKQVEFIAEGGEHGLEAPVLAEVRDALLHIVRNAVAHGIESPEARVRAGKAPAGRVRLTVRRVGPRISFTCADDGGGVDVERVRRAAVREELLTPDEAAELSAEEAIGLILHVGISTSEEVDEVSGRGVGLGLLRQLASRWGAEVHARNRAGAGVTIAVTVPVSTASLAVLNVVVGDAMVSIPLDAVRGAMRASTDDGTLRGGWVREQTDGDWIPYRPLATLLGRQDGGRDALRSAIVLRVGGTRFALGVDRVVGIGHALVRRLPELAGPVPGVLGAWLDVRGDPVLIVDPAGAGRIVRAGAQEEHARAPRAPGRVLVVDDSLTSRMLEMSILGAAGYEVDVVASAAEALERVERHRYGLLLVDVEMPGMDGFELVERLRSDPDRSDLPTIFVSSRATAEDRRRSIELGARAYVDKNRFDEQELIDAIRGVLGGAAGDEDKTRESEDR